MGNTAARQRLKAQDFAYISRNTAFLSRDVSFTFNFFTISIQTNIIIYGQLVKIVSDYYTELMSRCPDGKMEPEVMTMTIIRKHGKIPISNLHILMFLHLKEFKKIFRLAFPERPEDKLELLTTKVANVEKTDGKIREQLQLSSSP